MNSNNVFTALGAYGRSVEIKKYEGICFECRQKKSLLIFDNSNEEYTPMKFCIDCLNDLYKGKISKSSYKDDVRDI